jgi:hypothetical protein
MYVYLIAKIEKLTFLKQKHKKNFETSPINYVLTVRLKKKF